MSGLATYVNLTRVGWRYEWTAGFTFTIQHFKVEFH